MANEPMNDELVKVINKTLTTHPDDQLSYERLSEAIAAIVAELERDETRCTYVPILRNTITRLEGALRKIAVGKIAADNDSWMLMAGRLVTIAQKALSGGE
jgi:hypothetical protein